MYVYSQSFRAWSSTNWCSIVLESKLWEAGVSRVSKSVTSLFIEFFWTGPGEGQKDMLETLNAFMFYGLNR